MQKITSTSELRNAIYQLELKQELQGQELKEKFYATYDSFKSINMVKKILLEIATSPGLVSGVIKTIAELVDRKSHKKSTTESSGDAIKNIVRALIKSGITTLIIQNADTIRLVGISLIQRLFSKKEKKAEAKE